jgi:hypothetical protein
VGEEERGGCERGGRRQEVKGGPASRCFKAVDSPESFEEEEEEKKGFHFVRRPRELT